jgi:hypothetical protein
MKLDLFNCFLLLITQHDVHDERERDSKRENKRKESESPSMSVGGEGERVRCSRCFPPTLHRFHSSLSEDTM